VVAEIEERFGGVDVLINNAGVAYRSVVEHVSEPERMMALSIATPEKVARKIVKTMERRNPPLRVPGTPDAYLFDILRRFLPRPLYHWILYKNLPGMGETAQLTALHHRRGRSIAHAGEAQENPNRGLNHQKTRHRKISIAPNAMTDTLRFTTSCPILLRSVAHE
jgi:NAD(P)-dependent dehydrogenase (short-subunit alcohol dehydrogenase family)